MNSFIGGNFILYVYMIYFFVLFRVHPIGFFESYFHMPNPIFGLKKWHFDSIINYLLSEQLELGAAMSGLNSRIKCLIQYFLLRIELFKAPERIALRQIMIG